MLNHLRWIYAIAVWLLVAAIVIQFLLAGVGVFAPANLCGHVPDRMSGCGFGPHTLWAEVALLPLFVVVLALSFFVRARMRVIGLGGALLALFVLQGLLLWPYYDGPSQLKPLSALHVVNGVLILFTALRVGEHARELLSQEPGRSKTVPSEIVVRPVEAKGE